VSSAARDLWSLGIPWDTVRDMWRILMTIQVASSGIKWLWPRSPGNWKMLGDPTQADAGLVPLKP